MGPGRKICIDPYETKTTKGRQKLNNLRILGGHLQEIQLLFF